MKTILTLFLIIATAKSLTADIFKYYDIEGEATNMYGITYATNINRHNDAFAGTNETFSLSVGDRVEYKPYFDKNPFIVCDDFLLYKSRFIGKSGLHFKVLGGALAHTNSFAYAFDNGQLLSLFTGYSTTYSQLSTEEVNFDPVYEGKALLDGDDSEYLSNAAFGVNYQWGVSYSPISFMHIEAGLQSVHHSSELVFLMLAFNRALLYGADYGLSLIFLKYFNMDKYNPISYFILKGAFLFLTDRLTEDSFYFPFGGDPTVHYNQFVISLKFEI